MSEVQPTETPLVEQVFRGAILMNTPEGLKAFTLQMTNPEILNPDDLVSGEPQAILTSRGEITTYMDAVAPTKYQSSMWRYDKSTMLLIIFSNHVFTNEAFYPVVSGKKVSFKLVTSSACNNEYMVKSGRKIVRFGDTVPTSGPIGNLETLLDCKNFGLDGYLTTVRFKNVNGGVLDFGSGSGNISAEIRTVGVKLDKVPKLFKLPVHNMHPDGKWCISGSSLSGLLMNPTTLHPGPMFSDLTSAPANLDLEYEHHKHMTGVPILHPDKTKAPIMQLVPETTYAPENVTLVLPPIWNHIKPFTK